MKFMMRSDAMFRGVEKGGGGGGGGGALKKLKK